MAPLEEKGFINLEDTISSLNILKKYVHCDVIRLLGGEPTLNPALNKIVDEIRKIGIANNISIPTNGILLNKLSDDILEKIDIIEISNYNYSDEKTNKIIEWCEEKKEKYNNIKFYMYMYDAFREPCSIQKNKDKNLIKKIYDTCIIAHKWQCFNVYNNYFFKCPEAMALCKNIDELQVEANSVHITDSKELEEKIKEYINNKEPIPACSYCLGTTGKKFKTEQITKEKYLNFADKNINDLLDQKFLNKCIDNDIWDMENVSKTIEI